MHMMTVHSSQCHLPCWKIPQMPTPWARLLNIYYERCSLLFTPTLHAVFAKHPKTRNLKAENGSILAEKRVRPQVLKCSWQKLTEKLFEPRRSNCVFLRGHIDPQDLYLIYVFTTLCQLYCWSMMLVPERSRYVLVIPTKRRTCTAAMVLALVHLDYYHMLVLVLVWIAGCSTHPILLVCYLWCLGYVHNTKKKVEQKSWEKKNGHELCEAGFQKRSLEGRRGFDIFPRRVGPGTWYPHIPGYMNTTMNKTIQQCCCI